MKKVLCIAMSVLMTVVVAYAEGEDNDNAPGLLGLGYQGSYHDGNVMDQISLRWTPQPIGGQILFGHMRWNEDSALDEEAWLFQARGLYTLIDRKNSDFYVGGALGWVWWEETGGSVDNEEDSFLIGALAGVEWRFNEIPELGFNFEVGYNYVTEDEDFGGSSYDSTHKGDYVSLGAHYYF